MYEHTYVMNFICTNIMSLPLISLQFLSTMQLIFD